MALRANISKSATNFIEYYKSGVTLKSRTLKQLIAKNGITLKVVADWLQISKHRLIEKLYKRQRFTQDELTRLIKLIGARAAIKVIWFPTLQEKSRVEKYVWKEQLIDEHIFLNQLVTIDRHAGRIEQQNKDNDDRWEQDEDFDRLIFNTNKLPSRRFMRRRNNG